MPSLALQRGSPEGASLAKAPVESAETRAPTAIPLRQRRLPFSHAVPYLIGQNLGGSWPRTSTTE